MNIVGDSEHFKQPYDNDDDYISRTGVKRESEAFQELGKQLVSLSKSQLAKMDLEERVLDCVLAAKSIKTNTEAYRRQLQYIGKVMRSVDPEPIRLAMDKVLNKNNNEAAQLQIFDKLKERLLTEGDSEVQALLEAHPQLDRQKLRQLVRQSNKELAKGGESKSAKELVKYLRTEIQE
ncbi:ribosome biogenesis factor YjgA [Shewanella sp. NIFS-20-20]|uniref:ribosome biogenesis factor YjgA n=1 Tax=Shewanella sp. NIFS-20-20 TaxID=2853806 RepID=UPI001C450544|nr:ribosome biogenesis factor YjgA [Shewanella sp. NIFS-20-20]MBV7317473.1 ribosome-associated protein [Shewanella sp. NIFS-20-20]